MYTVKRYCSINIDLNLTVTCEGRSLVTVAARVEQSVRSEPLGTKEKDQLYVWLRPEHGVCHPVRSHHTHQDTKGMAIQVGAEHLGGCVHLHLLLLHRQPRRLPRWQEC